MAKGDDDSEEFYARRRVPGRYYFSQRWKYESPHSADDPLNGRAARFGYTVFDENAEIAFSSDGGFEVVIRETPSRQQVKLIVLDDERSVPRLTLQRFSASGKPIKQTTSFHLEGDEVARLLAFLQLAVHRNVAIGEDDEGLRLDAATAKALLADDVLADVLQSRPDIFEHLLRTDAHAPDVVAVARRRAAVELFERLLTEPTFFQAHQEREGSQPERVWQNFFERNRWIFGLALAPQFLSSWDPKRYEQTVRGSSMVHDGKRPDAVLRTNGALSALVLVEIKQHSEELLRKNAERPGCFAPSKALTEAVAQCQLTADEAHQAPGTFISGTDEDGFDSSLTMLCRPRSLLVVGSLSEFTKGDNQVHRARALSFERYRRSLTDPEIITYDELLERARVLANPEATSG